MVKVYKIRKITVGCPTGDAWGITIPSHIAEQYANTLFTITSYNGSIILQSGCNPIKY